MALFRQFAISLSCLAMASVAHSEELPNEEVDAPVKTLNEANQGRLLPTNIPDCYRPAELAGCSEELESFCTDLYSTRNKGNLDLKTTSRTIPLRFGNDKAGLPYSALAYQQAKLAAQDRLPRDLRTHLEATGYFDKVKAFISDVRSETPTRQQKIEIDRRYSDLGGMWLDAIERSALDGFEKDHPGFGAKDHPSMAELYGYQKHKSRLMAEIYTALWKEHPAWKRVEGQFEQLRAEYLGMLKEDLDIPGELRDEWIERIRTIKLTVPGSDPEGPNQDYCGTTEVNAYYNRNAHQLTVCAGDFNAEDPSPSLGHEMSHALDINSSIRRHMLTTTTGKELLALKKQLCSNAPISSCPEKWKALRANPKLLAQALDGFKPPVPAFLRCLQYRPPSKKPTKASTREMAEAAARANTSALTEGNTFLLLSKKDLINAEGAPDPNPDYLNPCGSSSAEERTFDMDDTIKLLFTLEYVCSQEGPSKIDRLRSSIQSALNLQKMFYEKTIPAGGTFSQTMTAYGFAEDTQERFSDALGFRAYARLLKKTASLSDRRKLFFAGSAWTCKAPSLSEQFPEEAQVEREFSLEPHSFGKQRRLELLTTEIRDALGCRKDFEQKDCKL